MKRYFRRCADFLRQGRAGAGNPGHFNLLRYFASVASLAFVLLGGALYALETLEVRFFIEVQGAHLAHVGAIQEDLARLRRDGARQDLLAVYEASHVTLATTLANAIWARSLQPLIDDATRLQARHPCQAPPSVCNAVRHAAFSALPSMRGLNKVVFEAIRGTRVFKIKVFDRQGITVFSSEALQIGEDKADNQGWRKAVAGTAASELTHRKRFSTFEGVVEDRDLISTYIPVRDPVAGAIVGVFEIYSDVTPILQQIDRVTQQMTMLAEADRAALDRLGENHRDTAWRNAWLVWLTVAALLLVLYVALYVLVRNAQRIIDQQARERQALAEREREWHHEKMATLATVAAEVAHETNNPLVVISMLADQIETDRPELGPQFDLIRTQVQRVAQMTRRIADFANVGGRDLAPVDVNQALAAIVEFIGFDRRFRAIRIECDLAADLPTIEAIGDQVVEALMLVMEQVLRMLQREATDGERVPLRVSSIAEPGGAMVAVAWPPSPGETVERADALCAGLTSRLAQLGLWIEAADAACVVHLPTDCPHADEKSA